MPLPSNWLLPERITQRFGKNTFGQQRALIEEGHLVLVLHRLPKQNVREREPVFFWRNPEGQWETSEYGRGIVALQEHIDGYEKAEQQMDHLYDRAKSAEDYFAVLEQIAPLHRAARNMATALQSAREGIPEDRALISIRDEALDIDRSLELLYVNARNALDYSMAKRAEEQAELSRHAVATGHRLNVLAAIFFPLTAIGSLFGMNLVHGFESAPPLVFWFVFAAGLLLGFVLRAWVLQPPVQNQSAAGTRVKT